MSVQGLRQKDHPDHQEEGKWEGGKAQPETEDQCGAEIGKKLEQGRHGRLQPGTEGLDAASVFSGYMPGHPEDDGMGGWGPTLQTDIYLANGTGVLETRPTEWTDRAGQELTEDG